MKNTNPIFKTMRLFLLVILTGFITTLKCQTIQIDSTFTTDAEIFPFSSCNQISGLRISGRLELYNDTSLVRLVLTDSTQNELMIYEAYPLIVDTLGFAFTDVCDETCYLDEFTPYSIRIEIINAVVDIYSLTYTTDPILNALQLQNEEKFNNDSIKLEKMQENIPEYNLSWIAGDNHVIHYYYRDKKNIFGDKYNLCGYEYYIGGIFSFPGQTSQGNTLSAYVKNFDWRKRHGANNSDSPYYDGDDTTNTGWLTSVKDQGNVGTCWAFSAIGATEALTNLYFNQQLDYDLSEQDLVSCSSAGSTSGGEPYLALDYISQVGIVTENCFPYYANDTICDTTTKCVNPDTIIKIHSYTEIVLQNLTQNRAIDTLKKALITRGPLSFTIPLSKGRHAITLSGFVTAINNDVIWICKDQLGSDTAQVVNGFRYIWFPDVTYTESYSVNVPIEVISDSIPDTLCRNEDGDDYYYWGIGPKPDNCPTCPDVPDCDDSNPNLGPYGADYSCDCLIAYSSDTLFITSDTIWTTNINQGRDIVITNGGKLTITGQVAFAKKARLIVRPGGELIIDGGVLTKACSENWMGIEVWGNPDTTQNFTYLQGYFKIENNGKIEFAQTAVFTGKKNFLGNIIDGYEGGIVIAKDAVFSNNVIDVEFRPYQNMHPYDPGTELRNLSSFRNCEFLTDFSEGDYIENEAHVILRDVKGINFYGCDFKFIEPEYGLTTGENGTGILCYDASFSILPRCTDPNVQPCTEDDSCRFENLKYGIRAFNNGDTRIVRIKEAIFTQNTGGIYLSGYIQPEIISNRLYCGTKLLQQKNQNNIVVNTYGLYLDECTDYHIENNTFYEKKLPNHSPQKKAFGIYVKNSGHEANEIYNNFLHNLSYGIVAAGINRGEESGLCIKCNDFYNNVNDIFVVPDSIFIESRYLGIAEYQGADTSITTAMAGNTFTPYQAPAYYVINFNYYNDFDCGYINYFHHQRQEDPLTYPLDSNYTRETISLFEKEQLNFIKDQACPSRINGGGNDPRGEMAAAQEYISTNQNQLDVLVDGGSTQDLNYDVMFSIPDEALQVRQQLLNESPYLSDTVMKQAIDKENVLPNAMVRDVLVANPQSAKTNEVLTALDERFMPMPDYMMAEIMQGHGQLGAKEILESKLGFWQNYYRRAKNKLIRNFLTDTLILASNDSLIALYQNENDLNSKYRLAFSYFYNKQVSQAINTINNIPVEFELDNFQTAIHQDYEDYFNILQLMNNNGWNAWHLDTTSISTLLNITDNDFPLVSAYVRGMLVKGGHINYTEQLLLPASYKSSPVYNIYPSQIKKPETDYLKLFPNPAGNYVILEYDLIEIFVNCTVIITDMNGKMVDSFMLKDKQNQIVLNLKSKPNGIYIFNLYAGNELLETEKLTISK